MHDLCIYHIEIKNHIDQESFNATSPLKIKVAEVRQATTLFTVSTDQSGFVGLIRHLHRGGFKILSVGCTAKQKSANGSKEIEV